MKLQSRNRSDNFSNPGGLEQHDEGWTCRENRLRLFGPDVVVPSFCEKTQLQPQEYTTQKVAGAVSDRNPMVFAVFE
jgi:hypothetical protein